MTIQEIFERYDMKSIIAEMRKQHESFIKYINLGIYFLDPQKQKATCDYKEFLTGGGISSIDQTMSGLGKDSNKVPWNNNSYSDTVWEKRIDIINKCNKQKFSSDWYKDLLSLFPTEQPNNITNRFLATIFYNELTTIVSWNKLKDVLEFIGEKDILKGKRSNPIHWLELNHHLHGKIKEALIDEVESEIIPCLGWKLVELIDEIKKNESEYVKNILENNFNVILTGAPGTGKTYMAMEIAAKMINCGTDVLENNPQFGFVQFHPSYDYTDFVEGLRPKKESGSSEVKFELNPGIFKTFCDKAKADEEKGKNKPYVFVIDEINRGEMSKIFGELFFSIDPGYRGKSGAIQTQYANMHDENTEKFYVPKNVYIIGTMNDIDRSVESMDFAFRRRFAFYEVKASTHMLNKIDKIKSTEAIGRLKNMMTSVNEKIIELGLTDAFQIGGSYFCKINKYYSENNDFEYAKFKIAVSKLWDYHLKGTLYEYFRGEPDADKKMDELKKAYDKAIANG